MDHKGWIGLTLEEKVDRLAARLDALVRFDPNTDGAASETWEDLDDDPDADPDDDASLFSQSRARAA